MRDKLLHSRMKLAEFELAQYRATAEEGCSIETALKPEYWAHVADKFRIGDEVVISAEDGSWRLHLLVADTDVQSARMRELQRWEWSADDIKPAAGGMEYEAVWKGPHDKWCIKRLHDDVIVQKQITDKAEAARIAADYAPKAA